MFRILPPKRESTHGKHNPTEPEKTFNFANLWGFVYPGLPSEGQKG